MVKIGAHETRLRALGDIPGECDALVGFIDGENGPYNRVRRIRGKQTEGKEQPAGRKISRLLAQVGFIQGQSRLAVKLIKNVTCRAGDQALRAERIPTSE